MRIFGKVIQSLRLSRKQSNFKPRCYSLLLSWHNVARRCTINNNNSNRLIKNISISKSDSSGKGYSMRKGHITAILPVAVVESESPTTTTKIMLIPINLNDDDEEVNSKTMKTLSVIRQHARQIEAFTENLMDSTESVQYSVSSSANKARTRSDQYSGNDDDVKLWNDDEDVSNSQALQKPQKNFKTSNISLYENVDRAVAEHEVNGIEMHDCYEVAAWNSSKKDLIVIFSESLKEKLQQMAASSMQFEMNMSNIRDAILKSAALKNIDFLKPTPKSLLYPTPTLKPNLDLEINDSQNALIRGTVKIDPSKSIPTNLRDIKVPEFNYCFNAIAANIYSTPLQKGFPADISRMAYSTNTPITKTERLDRNPHIVCVREGAKGCISPGNSIYANFIAKDTARSNVDSKKVADLGSSCISSEISLLSSSEIIGYNSRGLMSCKAYARALVEASKLRAKMFKAKIEPNEEAQTFKKEAIRKKDKCGDPKNNPCSKPVIDECGNEIKKNCPDGKKEKKTRDPCKEDPCKKADTKEIEAYQFVSSKTPCGGYNNNKNKGKDDRKNTGCGKPKNKRNRCNSETDACKIEKKCPKPKKKICDLGDPCNPCAKQEKKPEKPKKQCSSAAPVLYSVKCPLPGKQTEVGEKDSKGIKNLCSVEKSKSNYDIKKAVGKCDSSGGQKRSTSLDSKNKNKCRPFNSVKEEGKKPKKSASDSKCGPLEKSTSNKEQCRRYEGFCTNKKTKSSCSKDKKTSSEKSESKCKPLKSLCDSKESKSSTDKKLNSYSVHKCKPIKSLCDLKESKSACSTDKMSSSKKTDLNKSKSLCSPGNGVVKKSKPIKNLCDLGNSGNMQSKSVKNTADFQNSSIKSGNDNKSNKSTKSGDNCERKKKPTSPNCNGKSGLDSSSNSGPACRKYSTLANSKTVIEILPMNRYFSNTASFKTSHGLISWRQFSSKKGSKGNRGNQGNPMCTRHKIKKRSKRVDVLARKEPKDCYAEEDDMCQEKLCKDIKESSCFKNVKERK